eukprot:4173622-Alexandrium_andersonii.AAC.1
MNWLGTVRHRWRKWKKSFLNTQKRAGPSQQTTGARGGATSAMVAQYSGVAHFPLRGGREH